MINPPEQPMNNKARNISAHTQDCHIKQRNGKLEMHARIKTSAKSIKLKQDSFEIRFRKSIKRP